MKATSLKFKLTKTALTTIIIICLIAVVVAFHIVNADEKVTGLSIKEVVNKIGRPDFLAYSGGIVQRRVKALHINVPQLDPQDISDWGRITNITAIWVQSEDGKKNAQLYYFRMKNEKPFDGSGWYSSRPLFGEKIKIATIDNASTIIKSKNVRVDAIAISLDTIKQPKK